MKLWQRALGHGLVSYARAERRVERGRTAARHFVQGLATAVASDELLGAVGARVYEEECRPERAARELFEWERELWERELPREPARVFVGGAGEGREVRALLARGHSVVAIEPAPSSAAHCATLEGPPGTSLRVHRAAYADLVRVMAGDATTSAVGRRLAEDCAEPFDVFLFGWGSLTHVTSRRARERVLRAADRLCPKGPLLASFFLMRGEHGPRRTSRAEALGKRVGRALGGRERLDEQLELVPHLGFCHTFSCAEIEALGESVGRHTRWGDTESYGHVAWRRTR